MSAIRKHSIMITLTRAKAILVVIVGCLCFVLIAPDYQASVCHSAENNISGEWFIEPGDSVPVRTGIGQEYRIVAMAAPGTRAEVLEDNNGWVRVRLRNNVEGWMPAQYLTRTHPLQDSINSLQAKNAELEKLAVDLKKQIDTLSGDSGQRQDELKNCINELAKLRAEHEKLLADAANVLRIKDAVKKTESDLTEANRKLQEAEEQIRRLRNNAVIKWFLAGGLVMFTGWLLGKHARRNRKLKSSLL